MQCIPLHIVLVVCQTEAALEAALAAQDNKSKEAAWKKADTLSNAAWVLEFIEEHVTGSKTTKVYD